MTNKEGKGRDTSSSREERMAREEKGDHEERKKRPLETCDFECLTARDCPNKCSKSDDSESEDGVATDDLDRRAFSPEKTPRPRTLSPTLITASLGSTTVIVH